MIDFWKWRVSNEDPTKMVSLSTCPVGVCAARLTCEEIRREFGVRVSNKILCDLATIRETNRRTLSEIATSLFEAGQAKRYKGYHVVDISRNDLAARRRDFAWGQYDMPESMGIPAPTRKAFRKFEVESDIIDRMLMSLGYKDFFLCNPNDGQKVECGADVLTKLDHLIGFQVIQYHFDLGMDAETKGSRARVEESHKRRAGLPVAMWTAQFSMPALVHLLQEKSKKGWSQRDFPDMRLVIAASVPQEAGTASTFLLETPLGQMNAELSPILERNKYSAAYLYVILQEVVYKWAKETGWKNLACVQAN
ncbi:MAG: hypothetical protein WAK31_22230 [Chthoniobacterales bacterium]